MMYKGLRLINPAPEATIIRSSKEIGTGAVGRTPHYEFSTSSKVTGIPLNSIKFPIECTIQSRILFSRAFKSVINRFRYVG
jgi:hypothetical protein